MEIENIFAKLDKLKQRYIDICNEVKIDEACDSKNSPNEIENKKLVPFYNMLAVKLARYTQELTDIFVENKSKLHHSSYKIKLNGDLLFVDKVISSYKKVDVNSKQKTVNLEHFERFKDILGMILASINCYENRLKKAIESCETIVF